MDQSGVLTKWCPFSRETRTIDDMSPHDGSRCFGVRCMAWDGDAGHCMLLVSRPNVALHIGDK